MYPLVSRHYQHLHVHCKYSSVMESWLCCNSRGGQVGVGTEPAPHFPRQANTEAAALMFASCSDGK